MQRIKIIQILSSIIVLLCIGWGGYYFLQKDTFSDETYRRESKVLVMESSPVISVEKSTSTTSGVTILFVGDMMFDRHIRKMAMKSGEDFLFSCIDPLLMAHDLVVGNLEGPITTKPSTSMNTKVGSPENYYFTFPTSTASLLYRHNITIVNIGNNHIHNQGKEGVVQTKAYLRDNQVAFFGGLAGDSPLYRTIKNGIPISFINYNQFGGDSEKKVASHIKEEKSTGRVVIIYAHWGEEYKDVVFPIRATAKLFAQSGADLIIGSHPHVIQSHEMIGSTPVYYSLGNFIFDQYFEPGVMKGLTLSVSLSKNEITVNDHPVVLTKDGRTCPVQN